MAGTSIQVPTISQADMIAFHDQHFAQFATDHFHSQFLQPSLDPQEPTPSNEQEEEYYYEDDDDGLGYYPDGVKRTLTDEQIAIFRHSELEALRRGKQPPKPREVTALTKDLSEGEISSPAPVVTAKKNKKRKRNNKNKNVGEPPMDLRKRTWDVVDKGLASLDYGEEETQQTAQASTTQRRRISYDD
ncbi:hypothetical protein QBC40DRAFT_170792 [Triangularia verruculosa]|uniref:Uncharacterized protein n=1 Tax=Triangularia verruculosa TaxID=2587418 RepID=A0AAN6XM89_9PEZI|nr:hypothetical protein QBC40DRAFT_170792 [Triangularia verruculosa]